MGAGSSETPRLDLEPAARQMEKVVAGIRDDQLPDPTPCEDTTVAQLIGHVAGLTLAFTLAAEKVVDDRTQPPAGRSVLPADWRELIPRRLDDLVAAWRDPAAWEGQATAGGVTMPAADMSTVVLDELVLHGWDLAVATGQPFEPTPTDAEAVLQFASAVAAAGPEGPEGLFGPPVAVATDASAFDRALGLAGRDPFWRPGA